MGWEEGTRHRRRYLMRYGTGDGERDSGEHEAVWESRGGGLRADCGGTLGSWSEGHVEDREEGDGVNAEEEAFGICAMDYIGAYNRAADRLRDTVNA